jgi:hypothetical protein
MLLRYAGHLISRPYIYWVYKLSLVGFSLLFVGYKFNLPHDILPAWLIVPTVLYKIIVVFLGMFYYLYRLL